jgi:hypothetical protein
MPARMKKPRGGAGLATEGYYLRGSEVFVVVLAVDQRDRSVSVCRTWLRTGDLTTSGRGDQRRWANCWLTLADGL